MMDRPGWMAIRHSVSRSIGRTVLISDDAERSISSGSSTGNNGMAHITPVLHPEAAAEVHIVDRYAGRAELAHERHQRFGSTKECLSADDLRADVAVDAAHFDVGQGSMLHAALLPTCCRGMPNLFCLRLVET